jgi:hypothetical protein
VTPSSLANASTLSQVFMRSTAMRWNFREYRFLLSTRVSSPGECAHRECANSRGHSTFLRHRTIKMLEYQRLIRAFVREIGTRTVS